MINRFVLNEVSYFGPGARQVLPQEVKRLGLHKAFVATDKDLIKFGVADKVLDVLRQANIPYEIFSEIKPNPTVSNVKAGVEAFAKSGADFILAIGGGSAHPWTRPKPSASSPTTRNSLTWFHWRVRRTRKRSPCPSSHCPPPPARLPR